MSEASVIKRIASLTWPKFREYRGAVLLNEGVTDEEINRWWTELGGDQNAVEQTINHVHLYDEVVDYTDSELPMLEEAMARIASAWRAKLGWEYPDRSFEVVETSEPDEYGPTLTFYSRGK